MKADCPAGGRTCEPGPAAAAGANEDCVRNATCPVVVLPIHYTEQTVPKGVMVPTAEQA